MNRIGLFIALFVAIFGGLLFGIFPQLDLSLAALFYNKGSHQFLLNPHGFAESTRRGAMWIVWSSIAPLIFAIVRKLIQPRTRLIISGRAIIFLLTTIFVTAVVLPNIVCKPHWNRPRPIAITQFNGSQQFKPWWDPRGRNIHNSSFFSGEAATAFWTYAPAALAPAGVRPLAFIAATLFGLATGILRMSFGGHFASDVLAAGVVAYLVAWVAHRLIYRWNPTQLSDARIDHWLGDIAGRLRLPRTFGWLLLAIAAITAARVIALKFSVVDLFPDEARYWAWSQRPAFGYFSKPPLIAWIIAAASHVCGDSEACLRSAAAVLYAGTALICYFIARHLYDERAAFWSGVCIALSTGVVFSARIISTDVALIFFWAGALLAYVKLLDRSRWSWSVILGLALGLGLLAKYAMIYFLFGVLGAGFVDARARRLWRSRALWLGFAIALILVVPNLAWNASHHLTTFRHTWGNIVGNGWNMSPLGALEFLISQFGVFSPILFATFLLALARPSHFELTAADRTMIAFALPPLLLVTAGALVTGAKANWAASSAVSITILAASLLSRRRQSRWLQASLAIGLAAQIALFVTDALADRISLDFLPRPDVYHRTLGWKSMSLLVRRAASANRAGSIVAGEPDVLASLLYYLRHDNLPILAPPGTRAGASYSDLGRPWTPDATEPVIFISDSSLPLDLARYYSAIQRLDPLDAATGPHSTRRFYAFRLSGLRQPATSVEPPTD